MYTDNGEKHYEPVYFSVIMKIKKPRVQEVLNYVVSTGGLGTYQWILEFHFAPIRVSRIQQKAFLERCFYKL